jgi:MFS family permease
MFIVWGHRVGRRAAGHAAMFCPVCRRPEHFRVSEVVRSAHLYWIRIERGERVAEELECRSCGVVLGFAPGTVAAQPHADADVLALAARTGPMSEEAMLSRVSVEDRLHGGEVSPLERENLLREAILALDYMHGLKSERGSQTSLSAVIQLLFIAGLVASALLWFTYADRVLRSPSLLMWCVGVTAATVLLGAVVVYRGLTDRRRAADRYILRYLARALAPLAPTPPELEHMLHECRACDVALAAAIRSEHLNAAIEAERSGGRELVTV